ncbi:hypothetical protein AVEN_174-1 [Araneus ventricosus]|uniref:Uncharacterized protein n=1 Tax=Araneus ventricosus TaxID=182803 RepID=A0A4Y2D252_ARAVE|nr:hypothetical protein AVEN_174-1 [Araneus ventricosus]
MGSRGPRGGSCLPNPPCTQSNWCNNLGYRYRGCRRRYVMVLVQPLGTSVDSSKALRSLLEGHIRPQQLGLRVMSCLPAAECGVMVTLQTNDMANLLETHINGHPELNGISDTLSVLYTVLSVVEMWSSLILGDHLFGRSSLVEAVVLRCAVWEYLATRTGNSYGLKLRMAQRGRGGSGPARVRDVQRVMTTGTRVFRHSVSLVFKFWVGRSEDVRSVPLAVLELGDRFFHSPHPFLPMS